MTYKKPLRRKNGSGSVVHLSGRRREPFEVRVNTRMDERNYPIYDVLGRYADRDEAMAALLKYNKNPYDLAINDLTFEDVYKLWFDWKYTHGKKKYSPSSIACTKAAFNKCTCIYNVIFKDIKTPQLQAILNNDKYSHAMLEHVHNLFKQMYKYAIQFDIAEKNYAQFTFIPKEDDDEHGVPFTQEDITKLWNNLDKPYVNSVLIFIYSGFRITELFTMPLSDIDINNMTFKGGIKTAAGKNRVVPIHSKIQPLVAKRLKIAQDNLFNISKAAYYDEFNKALLMSGITDIHTPHDCRHTFATMLDNAGANHISIKRLMGHSSGNDITDKIYTHKDIEQLRKAIEMIKD